MLASRSKAQVMHRIALAEGQHLYQEGEAPTYAYLILAGEMIMRRRGTELNAGRGAVIGLAALINRVYASSAQARGPCDVLAFTRRELRGMIRSDPDRAMPIIDAIIDLVGKIHDVMDEQDAVTGPAADLPQTPG